MKVRNGFVSNSSSSSFICSVCGEDYSGMDACLSESGMFECENGHTVCWEHALITEDDAKKIYAKKRYDDILAKEDKCDGEKEVIEQGFELAFEERNDWLMEEFEYDVVKEACPICSMAVISKSDFVDHLMAKTKIPKSEVLLEIKSDNARRKKVYDNEYIRYACNKLGVVVEQYEKELLAKYDSYDAFKESLFMGDK